MKKEDISYQTKKRLAESLKKHLEKKKFSKITISEIIADCGVNRKTFYYHFENIYELLKWMFEQEAVNVVKEIVKIEDYEEAVYFVMDYTEKNRHIINCVYDSVGRDELKRFFYADFTEIVRTLIESEEQRLGSRLQEEFKNFLCSFVTSALAEMLVENIKNRYETYDKEKILKYMKKILHTLFEGLISDEKNLDILNKGNIHCS